MEHVAVSKYSILALVGIVGSFLANMLGGWDTALQTLIIFMSVDYLLGIIVAGVFKNSKKSETGALESKAGWKGLCRKGVTLLIVLVAAQLDKMAETDVIRNAVIIGYITNEAISIIENAGLMGLPIPKKLVDAISVLKSKGDDKNV